MTHRGREQRSVGGAAYKTVSKTDFRANQVWMWDITYLNGPIKGMHYYLYMFSDLYSRKIVGWEVWESEDAKHIWYGGPLTKQYDRLARVAQ